MSGKISLALLASASCLCFASEASAIDASPIAEPSVIYAREPAPPAPVRMASAERSSMGGGFIEFLFGDAPQGGRYQQPAYQPQPDYGYGGRRASISGGGVQAGHSFFAETVLTPDQVKPGRPTPTP